MDAAPAGRAHGAHMGLEAVGVHRVAAVVVNRDRQEMVLDVRPLEALVGADETARLELVAGARAGAQEQPLRPDGRLVVPFQRRVQRDRLGAFVLQVHLQVILEIGADARQIGHHRHAEFVQQRRQRRRRSAAGSAGEAMAPAQTSTSRRAWAVDGLVLVQVSARRPPACRRTGCGRSARG